jgi:hypothetical protein
MLFVSLQFRSYFAFHNASTTIEHVKKRVPRRGRGFEKTLERRPTCGMPHLPALVDIDSLSSFLVLTRIFLTGRKVKCDGVRPVCGRCMRYEVTCEYDDFWRYRGKGQKEKVVERRPSAAVSYTAGPSNFPSQQGPLSALGLPLPHYYAYPQPGPSNLPSQQGPLSAPGLHQPHYYAHLQPPPPRFYATSVTHPSTMRLSHPHLRGNHREGNHGLQSIETGERLLNEPVPQAGPSGEAPRLSPEALSFVRDGCIDPGRLQLHPTSKK